MAVTKKVLLLRKETSGAKCWLNTDKIGVK